MGAVNLGFLGGDFGVNSGDLGSGFWCFCGGDFWDFGAVDFELNSGDLGSGLQGLWGGFWGFGAVDFGLISRDFGSGLWGFGGCDFWGFRAVILS